LAVCNKGFEDVVADSFSSAVDVKVRVNYEEFSHTDTASTGLFGSWANQDFS
jgi:hypothetical protein